MDKFPYSVQIVSLYRNKFMVYVNESAKDRAERYDFNTFSEALDFLDKTYTPKRDLPYPYMIVLDPHRVLGI